MSVRFRPEVASMPRYVPGKPPSPGPDGRAWKLASNENPFDPLPSVRQALADCAINRYPDPGNTDIAAAMAQFLQVGADHVVFGTGSVQVLQNLLSATCGPGDEVVFPWRSFEAYPLAVQMTGATAVPVPLLPDHRHDLDAMLERISQQTRAVMLCTPNNPTGAVLGAAEVETFLGEVPDDVLVILDEAYVEYVTDPSAVQGLDVIKRYPNVVSLRTFSKAYGMAGLRVGYAIGDPTITAVVQAATMPFAVSVPGQVAVLASLAAQDELAARVASTIAERERVLAGLAGVIDVPQAEGNFFWLPAGTKGLDAAQWDAKFSSRGLSVRAFHTGGAGDGVRVSIGEVDANSRVLEVIAEAS